MVVTHNAKYALHIGQKTTARDIQLIPSTSGTTSLSYKATLEVLKEFFREAKVDQHGPKPEAELMVAQEFHT